MWWVVCGFVVAVVVFAVVLGAWAAGECSEECCLCGPCDCLGNSGRVIVGLAGNAVRLLRSSTKKSVCVAGASLFFFFVFFFCFLLGVVVFSE